MGNAPVGVAFFQNDLVGVTSQKDSSVSSNGKCSGSLRIANYKTMQLGTAIPIKPGCDAVRVVVGAKYIYVSSRSDNKIIKIDKSDTNKRQAIAVGPNPVGMGLAPGNRLIVAASNRFSDAPGEINVVDTTTGKMIARIPGLKFPRGVAISPDGKTAAVTYYLGDAVELLHLG
jgi:DNA-binding beta-propeller fold protein YncE